jgi:hypothetical protein
MHFNTERYKDAIAIWQACVKARKSLSDRLKRANLMMIGSNSAGWVKAVSSYSYFVISMLRAQVGTASLARRSGPGTMIRQQAY